jgi:hypothetical protein
MPTYAILVTYRDMEPKVLPEFITKARGKYGDRFTQLYFDSGALKGKLYTAVKAIPDGDRLKIFISGHGGTGIQYITDDAQVRKQTVDDLTSLLRYALRERATSWANSANTEVNMVSCLFGRTPDSSLGGCPAVRLHQQLLTWHIYVDLVARTESIFAMATGRHTASLLNYSVNVPIYGKRPKFYIRKTQFSKIRCTYRNGVPVVLIIDYINKDEPYINSQSLEGRRILWADKVINELVKYIQPPKGQTEVTDTRHAKLRDLVTWYDMFRKPEGLRQKLADLLPEFSSHRGFGLDVLPTAISTQISTTISTHIALPKTVQLIKTLLSTYPE